MHCKILYYKVDGVYNLFEFDIRKNLTNFKHKFLLRLCKINSICHTTVMLSFYNVGCFETWSFIKPIIVTNINVVK